MKWRMAHSQHAKTILDLSFLLGVAHSFVFGFGKVESFLSSFCGLVSCNRPVPQVSPIRAWVLPYLFYPLCL